MSFMKKPTVSVIITCYNYDHYVGEAIQSVLQQTYSEIELIVINDGSTDNSDNIIRQLQKESNFTYYSQENLGVVKTRNNGVSVSNGEFVMQLDADDTLDESYVAECVEKVFMENLDIVYTQALVFGRVNYVTNFIDHDLEVLKHDNYIHASALIRRKILKKDPYDEYLDKLGNEDWDLFLDLCLDGARAGLVDKPLLKYRKHIDRKSRADSFSGLYNEMLVRHHVWNKQNAKHSNEFWYFSSQIEMLLSMINLYGEYSSQSKAIEDMKGRIDTLERHHPVVVAKKIKKHIKSKIK